MTQVAGVKKVVAPAVSKEAAPKAKKEKKEKVPTPAFDLATAVDAQGRSVVDKDGKLTAIPANYDYDKFESLAKEDFSNRSAFFTYKANVCERRIAELTTKAMEYRKSADRATKFGDDDTEKKVKKAQKIKAQLAAFLAELEKDGVDLSKL